MKKIALVIATFLTLFSLLAFPAVSFAATCGTGYDEQTGKYDKPIETSIDYGCSNDGKTDGITQIALVVINFLSIGVGIAVVAGIVIGAIRYITASGNAAQAQQGVTTIVNAIIGLILFIFMYAIINFLVPGGLLN